MQKGLGRRDQASDPDKGTREPGVVGGGGVEPGQIGTDQLDLEGSAALDAWQDKVAAGAMSQRVAMSNLDQLLVAGGVHATGIQVWRLSWGLRLRSDTTRNRSRQAAITGVGLAPMMPPCS